MLEIKVYKVHFPTVFGRELKSRKAVSVCVALFFKMQYFSILYFFLSVALYKVAEAASRTTPPSGALVVSKSPSSGQYSTVSDSCNYV